MGEHVRVAGRVDASGHLYTPEGERLIRRQGGVTTLYLPGGQEVSLTSSGAVKAVRYYSFGGNTVAVRTGPGYGDVTSLVNDPHQTAGLAINNVTHAVTTRRTDPYGNARGGMPTWPGDHGFLDKPTDTTGLTQVGARYYDGALGRFISVDPVMDLGKPQQWAAYTYADNNPMTFWDPTGLLSWNQVWKGMRKGAGKVGGFVKKYQGEIAGFVVGGVVTAGCLALTAGAGSIACMALGGAAGGAATNLWKSKVQKTQKFSWKSLAVDTALGAALGGLGGGAGRLAAKIPVRRIATAAGEAAKKAVNRATTAVANRASRVTQSGGKPNAAPASAKANTNVKAGEAQAGKADAPSCPLRNSFTAATPVLMADGSKKPIKDVKVGDLVVATDPATGVTGNRPVTHLIRHSGDHPMVELTLANGTTLYATDRHPFWEATKRKFADAISLKAGHKVLSAGVAVAIVSASAYTADLTAYNLSVDDLHTYYVGDAPVLVHNCGEGGAADDALPSGSEAADLLKSAERVGSGLKDDKWHRAATWAVDDVAENGKVFPLVGGDGVRRVLVQSPGEVNGIPGRFEWILDASKVTHQMFVRNGSIGGVPIKP